MVLFVWIWTSQNIFKRGRKNDKKEKESPFHCRSWQKCKAVPVFFKSWLKLMPNWIKKNRNTRYGLAVLRCAGLVGRPAKFEFIFWLGVSNISLQKIAVTLQKRSGKRHVWLLHWNEANGWMKWSLFPAFFVWLVCWGKDGTGEMELGLEIARWKVRNHSCRGVKSGLWVQRADWATGSGEGRTGLGSE